MGNVVDLFPKAAMRPSDAASQARPSIAPQRVGSQWVPQTGCIDFTDAVQRMAPRPAAYEPGALSRSRARAVVSATRAAQEIASSLDARPRLGPDVARELTSSVCAVGVLAAQYAAGLGAELGARLERGPERAGVLRGLAQLLVQLGSVGERFEPAASPSSVRYARALAELVEVAGQLRRQGINQ